LISPIIIHLRTSADGIPPLFITKRRRGTPPLVSGIFQAARIAPRVRPEAYITPDRYFTIVRRASPRQSERAQSGPRGGAKTSLSRRGIPLANGARCRGDDAAPRRLSTPLHAIYSYRKADESSLVAATCFAARSTEPSGTLLAAPLSCFPVGCFSSRREESSSTGGRQEESSRGSIAEGRARARARAPIDRNARLRGHGTRRDRECRLHVHTRARARARMQAGRQALSQSAERVMPGVVRLAWRAGLSLARNPAPGRTGLPFGIASSPAPPPPGRAADYTSRANGTCGIRRNDTKGSANWLST
jgi:hypothetical protein